MRIAAAVLALTLVTGVPGSAAAKWTQVRTPHYLLLGDARPGDIRKAAERFEQFHEAMQRVLSRETVTSGAPTVVLVFANEHSFRPYQPTREDQRANVGGLFLGAPDLNYVAVNAAGGAEAYPIIFHELTHLIVSNAVRQAPMWLHEGLAEYYSTFELRGRDQVIVGRPIPRYATLLRERFLPIRDLLVADEYWELHNDRNRLGVFYAQSWALVHFLRAKAATRNGFGEYQRRVSAGAAPDAALQDAFGLDLDSVDKGLRSYVRQFRMAEERWRLESPLPENAFETSDAPEAAVLPHLAGVLIRQARLEAAADRLARALELDPESAVARAVLAHLHLQQQRRADAWSALSGVRATDDFLSAYMLGHALLEYADAIGLETPAANAAVSLMREHFLAATRLDGSVAEAWHGLTHAHVLTGDLVEAEAAVRRALDLAPAREYYRLALAQVLARRHEFARARAMLTDLAEGGRTPDVRDRARHLLGTLAASFRTVQPGETRVFGRLTEIACGPDDATLFVESDEGVLRVVLPALDRVEFITYRNELSGEITCTRRVPPDPVYVTWRGGAPGDRRVETSAAVVEFTPKGFVP